MLFRSKTNGTGEARNAGQRGSRAPLVITIVVLAVVGSAYYAYYRKQAEYYTGRNLRLLAMLTAQVEGRVDQIAEFVRSEGKSLKPGEPIKKDENSYAAAGLRLRQCSAEPPSGSTSAQPKAGPGGVRMRRDIEETGRGWKLLLQAEAADRKPLLCGSVSIDDVVRPVFDRNVGAAFDVLLVANNDGTVLYSLRPPPSSSSLLGTDEEWINDEEEPPPPEPIDATDTTASATTTAVNTTTGSKTTQTTEADKAKSAGGKGKSTGEATTTGDSTTTADSQNTRTAVTDRKSGSPVLITNLKALMKRKGGWLSEYVAIEPASLTTGTDHMNVSLGGTDYVLFAQPYTYSRKPGTIGEVKSNQWIVCGLVSASRFRYDVSAVSTSVILIAIAIVLLALCCWPYLRIALIHPSQALTITDVVLIIICTIAGAAVLTLALLDAFAYRGITQTADEQLEQFSRTVNENFGHNVTRAMAVLEAAEKSTRDEALKAKALNEKKTVPHLPVELMKNPNVSIYPYIDSIAWIDKDGMQQVRFARMPGLLSNVSDRDYFKLAKQERTWTIPADGRARSWIIPADGKDHPTKDRPTRYVLEWVRSKSTGEVRAILAKKTDEAKELPPETKKVTPHPPFTVIALATELIDISHAVRPPSVEMAIIDENGEVIYHTDTQRIGYENFFAEADRNRDLRSAVVARRAGLVNATYWGDDQSMYVLPLNGSSWTLVTFRAKRLTRVLNVEATLLTLVMLLLSSTPYFIVYLAVLFIKPRYRAPRLWPDEARHSDYLRLSFILLALLLLFCLNNYALSPWASLRGIVIIPLLAIVTTYLLLHRTGAPRRFSIATAVWLIVTAMLVTHMVGAEINPDRFFTGFDVSVKTVLVLATLAVAVLTFLLLGGWKRGGRVRDALRKLQSRYGYSTLYRFCGVLLMIIGVVLPVIGFFTISRQVEAELLVKYGQLRAAAGLEHRIDHIVTLNALPTGTDRRRVYSDILANRLDFLFGSHWTLEPAIPNVAPWFFPPHVEPHVEAESCVNAGAPDKNWTIPGWASSLLPSLYEDSIAIRPLFAGGSSDNLWHWCVQDQLIKLVRKVQFDSDVAEFLWDGYKEKREATQKIIIMSHLPRTSFWKSSEECKGDAVGSAAASAHWPHLAAMILVALPLLAIFWYAADFVAKRVLLIDVHEPDWLARKPLSPTLGEHIFLVRRDRDVDTLTKGLGFVNVSFETLDQYDNWSDVLEKLDSSEAGRNVRVVDFEYGIHDGAINEKKLQWLECLLVLADRTVIIASAVSPSFVMTTPPPPSTPAGETAAYFERWRTLLQCFVTVTAEELDLRHEEWERRNALHTVSQLNAAGPKTWLEKETAYNSFLRRLYKELEAETDLRRARKERDPDTDRRRLLDELGERAETYFAGLWASCRDDEKLLLYQLAHNGLANGRNRRTLRRLIARGLVRRNPNLELFSESFRLYVLDAAQRENIVTLAREKRGASTWDSLRLPFFVIIISFLLLLFATQKDMLTTTTALATALTTGLPVLMKLVGVFTERRADGKE
jgi:hypothetical protein